MDNLVLRKGFIIDGNVVKCLLILKNGLEFVGVSKSSNSLEAEEKAYKEAMEKLERYIERKRKY